MKVRYMLHGPIHFHTHDVGLTCAGGVSTSFQSLKANLLLSSGIALTGIVVPIGLSYTLQGLLDATPVQAFAAGAALCSTSLGTTFTVLGSSGLSTTSFRRYTYQCSYDGRRRRTGHGAGHLQPRRRQL
jgi:hypothetical protein